MQTVQLRNLGDSEVHAYGFQVSSSTPEDEDDDSDEAEEDEEQEDDSDDDYEVDEDEEHARTPRHLRKVCFRLLCYTAPTHTCCSRYRA